VTFRAYPEGRFKVQYKIGEGSYGIVEKAIDTQSGQAVAIKTMKGFHPNESLPHFVLREYQSLDALQECENVVKLIGAYSQSRGQYSRQGCQVKFVFPFYEKGDLLHYLRSAG
jgi:serine/threonine protein kinase